MTPSERGRLIWRIGDLILEHADELAQLESLDNGKPVAVARGADVPLAADLFHYMAGWATKIEGNTINISVPYMPGANFHSYTLREPVGVVGQIIPWNFPLLMAAWKLGPALTTGNCVVLKPAEQTPLTALLLAELIAEAGVPDGVVNVVTGFGETAGAALAAHDDVDQGRHHLRRRLPARVGDRRSSRRSTRPSRRRPASSTCWSYGAPARTSPGPTRTCGGTTSSTGSRTCTSRSRSTPSTRCSSSTRPGTTAKPKGILHTTGGYLTQVAYTHRNVFDLKPDTDVYWCTADVGWVTGH